MVYELMLILCLSQSECITIRQQMSAGDCVAKLERQVEKYGYDPDHPPYLESEPKCTKLGEPDNLEWR